MAIFWDAPVSPDALTAFVREVPVDSELSFLTQFPTETTDDNTIDFAEIVRRNRTARYRNFDGSIHVSERDSGSTGKVKLAPLSTSLNESEYERLQREFARTGGTFTAAMEQAIYNDAENLTRYVQNRLQQGWGSVLNTGVLQIPEIGQEADYGVPGTHKVTAAVAWTDTENATVISDLEAWWDVYKASNGGVDASQVEIVTSLTNRRLAQRNKEVIDEVYGVETTRGRVAMSDLNEYLSDNGLPQFGATEDSALDVDGTITRVLPADKVLFLPVNRRQLGYTAMGVSATALELVESNQAELSFEEAPGIVGVVEKVGPPYRKFTFVDAVGQPILENAKRLFIADVA